MACCDSVTECYLLASSVVWVITFIVTSFVSSLIGEEPTWHEMEISTDCSHAKNIGKKTCPCKEPPQSKVLLLKSRNVIEYLFVSHTARFLSDNDSTRLRLLTT